jgi:hypothetical protein
MSNEIADYLGTPEMQDALIRHIAAGHDPAGAATLAGFTYPEDAAAVFRRDPRLALILHQEMQRRIAVEGAPLALGVVLGVLKDDTADPRLRVVCARDMLDRAGHIAPKAVESAMADRVKDPHEMTTDELREFVDKGEEELANRAKPVRAARASKPTVDIFD